MAEGSLAGMERKEPADAETEQACVNERQLKQRRALRVGIAYVDHDATQSGRRNQGPCGYTAYSFRFSVRNVRVHLKIA